MQNLDIHILTLTAGAGFVGLVVGFLIGWCGCAWLITKKVPASSNQRGEHETA